MSADLGGGNTADVAPKRGVGLQQLKSTTGWLPTTLVVSVSNYILVSFPCRLLSWVVPTRTYGSNARREQDRRSLDRSLRVTRRAEITREST
jgi:hypothetical protein